MEKRDNPPARAGGKHDDNPLTVKIEEAKAEPKGDREEAPKAADRKDDEPKADAETPRHRYWLVPQTGDLFSYPRPGWVEVSEEDAEHLRTLSDRGRTRWYRDQRRGRAQR